MDRRPVALLAAPEAQPLRTNLRRLVALRAIAVAGQATAILGTHHGLHVELPIGRMLLVVAAMALANLATWRRLSLPRPVSDAEFFLQLALDLAALTLLLYWSGGPGNPFVSLFLMPPAIAAAALPRRHTWLMTALAMGCYSGLMLQYQPLHAHHAGALGDFSLHVAGMWTTFLMSAGIIAWFVVNMNAAIRGRDRLLARAREDALRNEQIVAIGTLAAGAAHELGTPLSTMAVIARELEHAHGGDPALRDDVRTLRQQVDLCKGIISGMLRAAGHERGEGSSGQPIDRFLQGVVARWQLMRPGMPLHFRCDGGVPVPQIVAERALSQALINLLNNAADASPGDVEVEARWDDAELRFTILDRGGGIAPHAAARVGAPFFTTKPADAGTGIGLFLSNATLERFGGRVALRHREGGGTRTEVTVPLSGLRVRPGRSAGVAAGAES